MNTILNHVFAYVQAHPYGCTIAFIYNAQCMVNAMAYPGTNGGGVYGWLYRYKNLLLSNPYVQHFENPTQPQVK
jgi:hypothetical protein